MKIFIPTLLVGLAIGCSPAQQETASQDTTSTVVDTVAVPVENADLQTSAPAADEGDEYIIPDGYSYISDPFDFALDSTALMNMLGPETVITSISTEGGEDELGAYEGYTRYQVNGEGASLNFYSYSGKHVADISTSKIPFRNGVVVGMVKMDFLASMSLPDSASIASRYTINDDYGFMTFYFTGDTLTSIYVSYEEGD